MPRTRPQVRPPADPAYILHTPLQTPAYVQMTLVVDQATFDVLAADARDEGVPVEEFTARHLAKCAGASP
jgi:hypothetical protein